MRGARALLALGAALAMIGVACGSGGDSGSGKIYDTVGEGEGALKLIAWNGYVESGATEGYDWVTPFEKDTGCKVTVKYADTSPQMVTLMRQGGGEVYDGVSASGNATNLLIAHGDVAGIDVDKIIPDYDKIVMKSLQAPAHNTVDGVHYGVPYMWGPNFLMFNTDVVTEKPDSWNVVFEPTIDGQPNPYAGKVTAYNDSIYIADAAMYLMAHQPDLGITDPYELTEDQLAAAVDLLKQQKAMVSKYWALYSDEVDGFDAGDMVVGTAWPVNYSYIKADDKVPVDFVFPTEGMTGWADTWMMSANAPHPNCMLKWMQWTMSPEVQVSVAEFYGATPSITTACDQLREDIGEDADTAYHCGDDEFLKSIYLWKVPVPDCGDGKEECTDLNTWTDKWTEVTAG